MFCSLWYILLQKGKNITELGRKRQGLALNILKWGNIPDLHPCVPPWERGVWNRALVVFWRGVLVSQKATEAQSGTVYEKVPCHHLGISSTPFFFLVLIPASFICWQTIHNQLLYVGISLFAVKSQPSQSHCKIPRALPWAGLRKSWSACWRLCCGLFASPCSTRYGQS